MVRRYVKKVEAVRTAADQVRTMPRAVVGEVDRMSRMAGRVAVPLCREIAPSGRRCTRAAGHADALEGDHVGRAGGHPAVAHVHAPSSFAIVEEVW